METAFATQPTQNLFFEPSAPMHEMCSGISFVVQGLGVFGAGGNGVVSIRMSFVVSIDRGDASCRRT